MSTEISWLLPALRWALLIGSIVVSAVIAYVSQHHVDYFIAGGREGPQQLAPIDVGSVTVYDLTTAPSGGL
ncbi:MAG: hypothetical protein ACM4D3_22725 [Candidatus Sericytochromatia bacterium]